MRSKWLLIILLSMVFFGIPTKVNFKVMNLSSIPDPLFHVNLLAPISNPVRVQYVQRIERELETISISCDLDLVNWALLGPRWTDREVGSI
ncbi:MAG: hypothetical protein ACFFAE_19170 [Candidatus Hodarchaeota archaeon]